MKVSLNWAQEFSNVNLKKIGKDKLTMHIGAQLGSIDDVIEWGPRFDGIVVAKVISCEKHPDADKLTVCRIDDGGIVKYVQRDKEGFIQVVCGAPNVVSGLHVAWIPPGVVVPSTIDKDPFTLEVREIRGAKSNGMLASSAELGISDDHDGILEILADEVGKELIRPGTQFKKLYGLDDVVFDLENKMFTHRPDCFGILGVARELAGICGQQFKSPDWYLRGMNITSFSSNDIKGLTVENKVPKLCPRYMAIAIDNIVVGPSPVWLQVCLARVGIRPINNIVDITNWLMVLSGQPLHAFDFDKIAVGGRAKIVIRNPKKGEKMILLDGKEITPSSDAVLICNQDKPIALGGVMGGNNSEIDSNTKRIIIECANFDMYNIRRTAMEYGLFTDAVTRFNKGQSAEQCQQILYKAIAMTTQICAGAKAIGRPVDFYPKKQKNKTVAISAEFVNMRLGSKLSLKDIAKLLENVEFCIKSVPADKTRLHVQPPFWRRDIEIPEDIVEEVGRLYGYDKLPVALPPRSSKPASVNLHLETKKQLRTLLAAAGANEVLSYSFVHEDLMKKVGQNKENAYHIRNAISPDLQYYRMSLIPSLLDKVHMNIKSGYGEFAIFEMNKVHNKDLVKDKLPVEENRLALVIAVDDKAAKNKSGAAYYWAKYYLEHIASTFGITLMYDSNTSHIPTMEIGKAAIAPFEPTRSCYVKTTDGELLAELGEFKASVRKNLKLPTYCAGFELDIDRLIKHANKQTYTPLSKFPKIEQDISLRVSSDVLYADLQECIKKATLELQPQYSNASIAPLDIYQKDDDVHKQIAFRLSIVNYRRTLTADEVNSLLDKVAETAKQTFDAERI